MKKYLAIFVIGFLTLGFLVGCGGKTVKVDEKMNGSSVNLEKGAKLILKLGSNPTTGYDWVLAEYDMTVLQLDSQDYKSASMMIGSGGVNTYTFLALQSGKTHLNLTYKRSWERDVLPLMTFDLDVEVK
jgi:inhibitor of cysteine peptidase